VSTTRNKVTPQAGNGDRLPEPFPAQDLHLHVGEWIWVPEVNSTDPVRLEFAASRPNTDPEVYMVMLYARGRTVADAIDARDKVHPASEAQVAEAVSRSRRERVLTHLGELVSLLYNEPSLPVRDSPGGPSLTLHSRLSRAQLEAVGKTLGIEPVRQYGRVFEVVWRGVGGDQYEDLTVTWSGAYDPCPWSLVVDEASNMDVWVEDGDGQNCKFEVGHDGDHKAPPAPVKL
jgi:hypothetical protein